jgi:hypothetical protein
MTYAELLKYINDYVTLVELNDMPATANVIKSLRAVVELHKPMPEYFGGNKIVCGMCGCPEVEFDYPCPTIQAIEKELK